MNNKLTMLMILDGFGCNPKYDGNGVKLANIPNIRKMWEEYPTTKIQASELAVGLPKGQMGNSEVGHTNIGAGRIVYQELTKITKSIEDGDFFENEELLNAINNCKENKTKLHLFGLLSDGGVHSHQEHLYGLLELARRMDFKDVFVHCFLDGRDTPPSSAKGYVEMLENKMKELGVGKIATVSGRFYSMDRDKRWNRIEKAYDALVRGKGNKHTSATEAIQKSYDEGVTDEFVVPIVIEENGKPIAKVEKKDSVIFYNFRPDSAREITRTLVDEDFNEFETEKLDLYYVCFTNYDETLPNVKIAFKKEEIVNNYGETISKLGGKQLRIAETEKYAHVTFFFNGGEEKQYDGEDRILVPSPKVETYDLQPEMSAYQVCGKVVDAIRSNFYNTIILNFANPDMVGHTGSLEAVVKALEAVDTCVGHILKAIKEVHGNLLVTADHGNCEVMVNYDTGTPHTAHTTNLVPFTIVSDRGNDIKLKPEGEGKLADLAPTMLELLEIEKPKEMTGESLIVK